MDNEMYLGWMTSAMARFTGVIQQSDLAAPVPSCPDWDVAALVDHVVGIHTWVGQVLATGQASVLDFELEPPERDPAAYAAWYAERAAGLRAAMDGVDPDAPCWNFSGVNMTYGFWPRRQTNEVNVHAFDAALAAGIEFIIEPAAAADGIDELLTVFGPRMAKRGHRPQLTAPLAIEPTDADTAWTLHPPDGNGWAKVTGAERGAAASLTGTASDLYLTLWKRLPIDRITISGDTGVAMAYLGSRLAP